MAVDPHSLAFTLARVERGDVRRGVEWVGHDTSDAYCPLGTAVWVYFPVNSIDMLCRFVYVISGEAILATETVTVINTTYAASGDQFTVVKGGNTATGGAGLVQICGVNSNLVLSAGAYGWIQTHGPVLLGPAITGGAVSVVAQETMLNAPAKAQAGGCVVHTNAMTAAPFAVVTTTESTATPAILLSCTVF